MELLAWLRTHPQLSEMVYVDEVVEFQYHLEHLGNRNHIFFQNESHNFSQTKCKECDNKKYVTIKTFSMTDEYHNVNTYMSGLYINQKTKCSITDTTQFRIRKLS